MRIGFYAPLKAPDHPTPSGDRQMARSFIAALRHAGHVVEPYSALRSFARGPDEPPLTQLTAAAAVELDRLGAAWADPARRPDILFTYHVHYKAPDLLGPPLAARFGLAYATAEASLSERRATGPWARRQAMVAAAVRAAVLNVCLTGRDRAGLAGVACPGSLVDLPPFIDAAPFGPRRPGGDGPVRLMTVAMMRPGDKLQSYRFLGEALALVPGGGWSLTVIGDGAAQAEVAAALAGLPEGRVRFAGAVASEAVAGLLREGDIFVWPGFNEAFGLCYLEAQASGLPVVAVRNAGTPSVVRHGRTGLLTDPDSAAYAAAVAGLIADVAWRARLGMTAAAFVRDERSLAAAARVLDGALRGRLDGVAGRAL